VNIIKKAIVFICLLLSSSALFAQEPFRGVVGVGGEDKKREELGASNGWFESVDNAFDAINIGYSYNF
jgi:hypothetical protein